MKNIVLPIGLFAVVIGSPALTLAEAGPIAPSPNAAVPSEFSSANTRYGWFDSLDHRSVYGQGLFPEPFLVDDSDLEPDEARLDWLRAKGSHQQSDSVKAEVEKGFGLLTLELEAPYQRGVSDGRTSEGMGNVSLGARYPFYQFVSGREVLDSTFGAALEVGIPVNSAVSRNTELVPKVFNDLKVGNHFTLQSVAGYSRLFGGAPEGGLQTFEYGLVFGYTIRGNDQPLPGVQELVPVFELKGETGLNQDHAGHGSLLAMSGFRLNLKALGQVQPRLGLGWVFPLDQGARADTHWGVVTSLVFQY